MMRKALLLGVSTVLFLARSAWASGYNWTTGVINSISVTSNGDIGVGFAPTPTTSAVVPGETAQKPCNAEGQMWDYMYVILSTNANKNQFYAQVLGAYFSGRAITLYAETGLCYAGPWKVPVATRIDLN